jgi:hypothetical protein
VDGTVPLQASSLRQQLRRKELERAGELPPS